MSVKDFNVVDFEGFRRLAQDESLSMYERIGFPDSYRKGFEDRIFRDIVAKLPRLRAEGQVVIDVGPGCSELPGMLIDLCRDHRHRLLLVDSPEMLARLPDEPFMTKQPAMFPAGCAPLVDQYCGRVNVFLSYSVLQYVFVDMNLFDFLDQSLRLLAEGGELLYGDVPNVSMRKRFFSTAAGVRFHRAFTGSADAPAVDHLAVERAKIDDAVVLGLLMRARAAGFDAYVVPQAPDLPMANRREDILIRRAG